MEVNGTEPSPAARASCLDISFIIYRKNSNMSKLYNNIYYVNIFLVFLISEDKVANSLNMLDISYIL